MPMERTVWKELQQTCDTNQATACGRLERLLLGTACADVGIGWPASIAKYDSLL